MIPVNISAFAEPTTPNRPSIYSNMNPIYSNVIKTLTWNTQASTNSHLNPESAFDFLVP